MYVHIKQYVRSHCALQYILHKEGFHANINNWTLSILERLCQKETKKN